MKEALARATASAAACYLDTIAPKTIDPPPAVVSKRKTPARRPAYKGKRDTARCACRAVPTCACSLLDAGHPPQLNSHKPQPAVGPSLSTAGRRGGNPKNFDEFVKTAGGGANNSGSAAGDAPPLAVPSSEDRLPTGPPSEKKNSTGIADFGDDAFWSSEAADDQSLVAALKNIAMDAIMCDGYESDLEHYMRKEAASGEDD